MFEYKNKSNSEYIDMLMYETHGLTSYVTFPDDMKEEQLAMMVETSDLIEYTDLDAEVIGVLNMWRDMTGEINVNEGWTDNGEVTVTIECDVIHFGGDTVPLAKHTDEELLDLDIEALFVEMDDYHKGCNLANATKALKR